MNLRVATAVACSITLAGCDYFSGSGAKLVVEPPTSTACTPAAPGTVAKVSWDSSAANVTKVKVYVRGTDGKETLFAAGGVTGSAPTGRWINANTTFVLKDDSDTRILAEVAVKCDH